uniref:TNF alpha induced protein 2 n=1 Tax=Rhinopithecus bieti TaxID=61621 RepID=A0A2K6JRS5_RHIBE
MSVASSEDLAPPLEAGTALYREEEKTAKKKKEKKKKSKGLANVFCVFTKGKKKKGQLSSAEPEGAARSRQGLDGPPPTVEELKAALERGQLEAARSPLLAAGAGLRAAGGGRCEEEEPARWKALVRSCCATQVLGVLRRPLEVAPERLRQALPWCGAAAAAEPGTSGLAVTRPRRWLQLWRRGVAEAAEERMGQRPAAGPEVPESVFLHLGRTMKEDLEAVVERLKPLFPAEFGVVAAYAESYHQHFAAHLAAMAQFELCERDTYMLLVWVQNLYPNDIINSPKLAGELQGVGLGSLLPPRQIRLLEATFLSNEAANVRELVDRALELEAQHWAEDVPPQRLDGHCHSELAIDIIQIISQAQAKAESITLDLGSQIKQVLLAELPAFLRSYQRAFNEFLERGKQLRNYKANVMANINNCLSFRMSMEQKWQVPQDTLSLLLGPLGELKSHGFDTLLQNLREDLKPLFKRFTHTRWAAPMETVEKIITTVDMRLPEFSELQDCFREVRRLWAGGWASGNGGSSHPFAYPPTIHLPMPPTIIEKSARCHKGHLSAILAIKGNLSNSEVKSIRSILDVSTGAQEPSRSLFSLIKVG